MLHGALLQDIYSIHIRGADGTVQDVEFGDPSIPEIINQTANNVIAFSSAGNVIHFDKDRK